MPSKAEREIEFDLQKQIHEWKYRLEANPNLTTSDSEELKSHLLDIIDDLKDKGLDDEEAYWVASKRLGNELDWEKEFKIVNNPLLQMKKSLIILAGILIYFLLYYFLKSSSKLLLIALLSLKADANDSINWILRYFLTAHFLYFLFASSIFFMEKKTTSFIENLKLKPKTVIYLMLTTLSLGILDTCLLPVSKSLMKKGYYIDNKFYDINFYFEYSFPILICISFIIIYLRYSNKTKHIF